MDCVFVVAGVVLSISDGVYEPIWLLYLLVKDTQLIILKEEEVEVKKNKLLDKVMYNITSEIKGEVVDSGHPTKKKKCKKKKR